MDKVKNAYITSLNKGALMAYVVEYHDGTQLRAVFDRKGDKRMEKVLNGQWARISGFDCDTIASIVKAFVAGDGAETKAKPLNSAQQAQALKEIPAIVLKHAADEKLGAFMVDSLKGKSKSVDAAKLARAYLHEGDTVSAYDQIEGDPMALALLVQALDRDDQNRLIAYIDCLA